MAKDASVVTRVSRSICSVERTQGLAADGNAKLTLTTDNTEKGQSLKSLVLAHAAREDLSG